MVYTNWKWFKRSVLTWWDVYSNCNSYSHFGHIHIFRLYNHKSLQTFLLKEPFLLVGHQGWKITRPISATPKFENVTTLHRWRSLHFHHWRGRWVPSIIAEEMNIVKRTRHQKYWASNRLPIKDCYNCCLTHLICDRYQHADSPITYWYQIISSSILNCHHYQMQ